MGDTGTRVINQAHIDMCLNCDKTRCTNCFSRKRRYGRKGRPFRNYNPALLQQLIAQNLTNDQICKAMEICERTLKRYKKKLREENHKEELRNESNKQFDESTKRAGNEL